MNDDLYVFEGRNPFLTLLLSCHVGVTSKIQINFRYRRYSKVLMIVKKGVMSETRLHLFLFRRETFYENWERSSKKIVLKFWSPVSLHTRDVIGKVFHP